MARDLTVAQKKKREIERRQKIYNNASPALRAEIDWFIDWAKSEAKHSLTSRYELGEHVREIYEAQKNKNGTTYGKNAFKKINEFIKEDPSMLRMAMNLVNAYTKKEVEEIAEMVMSDGITHVSYSHVRALLSVDNKKTRDDLLQDTIKNCWTSAELSKRIHDMLRPGRKSPVAGKTAAPKTVDGLIMQQTQFANDWTDRYDNVWNEPTNSLRAKTSQLKPEEITEELASKVLALARKQRAIAEQASKMAEESEKQYEWMMSVLNQRGGGIKPVRVQANKVKVVEKATTDEDEEDEDAPRPLAGMLVGNRKPRQRSREKELVEA